MSDPYDARYFTRGFSPPYGHDGVWLAQFGRVADWIVAALNPATVLDAGCAMGLLVEALRDRGVDAYGIDISEHAIANVREDMRPYCTQASILDPFERRYDAIACIEVLEHLSAEDGQAALDNLCAHTDVVLFSSTPVDYVEATHLNVQPTEHWAAAFAMRGFFRDFELDATVATEWATVFRRDSAPLLHLVSGYERQLWHLTRNANGTRAAFDGMRAELAEHEAAETAARAAEQAALAEAETARTAAAAAQAEAEAERLAHARVLEETRAEAEATLEANRAEAAAVLDQFRATRTFRYTSGARRIYERLRKRAGIGQPPA